MVYMTSRQIHDRHEWHPLFIGIPSINMNYFKFPSLQTSRSQMAANSNHFFQWVLAVWKHIPLFPLCSWKSFAWCPSEAFDYLWLVLCAAAVTPEHCCSRGVTSVFVFCVKTEGCDVGMQLGRKDFVGAAPYSGLDPAERSKPLFSSACLSRLWTQEK